MFYLAKVRTAPGVSKIENTFAILDLVKKQTLADVVLNSYYVKYHIYLNKTTLNIRRPPDN